MGSLPLVPPGKPSVKSDPYTKALLFGGYQEKKMAFRSGKEIVREERWWPDGGVRGSRKLDPKVNRNS